VDEVLLVASSKSFAAVNREQFYVSISRGRERVHIFTDDSELLASRVTDSHERKAAIELQALRDDLAKLGFTRKAQETTSPPSSNVARQHRPARHFRVTRLSPLQKLAQVVEQMRRWLGLERTETVAHEQAAKVEAIAAMKPAETNSPVTKETPRVRPKIKLNVPPPRRSRGIGI
jgi:hypothetical protein